MEAKCRVQMAAVLRAFSQRAIDIRESPELMFLKAVAMAFFANAVTGVLLAVQALAPSTLCRDVPVSANSESYIKDILDRFKQKGSPDYRDSGVESGLRKYISPHSGIELYFDVRSSGLFRVFGLYGGDLPTEITRMVEIAASLFAELSGQDTNAISRDVRNMADRAMQERTDIMARAGEAGLMFSIIDNKFAFSIGRRACDPGNPL
jgi:hypothetical protein